MVREFKSNDFLEVLSLFYISVHKIACNDYTQLQLDAWAPESPDLESWHKRLSSGNVFVEVDNNQIRGFGRIENTGYIDLLYSHPDFLKQGIGNSILNRMIIWAFENKIGQIYSEVSITARQFFSNNIFFTVKEQLVERRGVTFKNFLMVRNLANKKNQN